MFPLGANTTTTETIHLFATLEKCFTVQNKLIQSGKKLLRIRFKLNELSCIFLGCITLVTPRLWSHLVPEHDVSTK